MALILLSVAHRWVPESRWLLVHMVTLGMVTNSILIWSQHFTEALLKVRLDDDARAVQLWRLRILNAGILATMAGVVTAFWPLTLTGAVVIGGVVAWHGVHLLLQLRRALPARFDTGIRFYIVASLLLPVGAGFGAALAYGLDNQTHARLLLAHEAINVLGFLGLTVMGTLLTFWPTILGTRIPPGTPVTGRWELRLLLGGVLLLTGGALAGLPLVATAGVLVYLAGFAWLGYYFVRCGLASAPNDFPALSVAAALLWLAGALGGLAVILISGPLEPQRLQPLTVPLVAGFAAQVLLGSMAYLLPAAIGGGGGVVRAARREMGRLATLRLSVINVGLLVCILPVASWVRVVVSVLVLAGYVTFLPFMVRSVRVSIAGRKAAALPWPGVMEVPETPIPVTRHLAGTAAGLALILAGMGLGVAIDPAAAGWATSGRAASAAPGGAVAATGKTTTVDVVARDMRFYPAAIEVPAGDRLVINLRNEDLETTHDLTLETGITSARVLPGESTTLDAGLIRADVAAWCSVVGHRGMGMTLVITARGAAAAGPENPGNPPGAVKPDDAAAGLDFQRAWDAGFQARKAELPSPTPGTVHRVTLEVEEKLSEVAPGVRQRVWTYNGRTMGPTLRGRVGDRFEITLVNRGTMGHSIDFHAGVVSPDRPMRTIPPGESLVYSFTAVRSGTWLYHCGTAPVSAHIASGMFGAVIIDPANLPAVDREFVLVQSEAFLGGPDEPVNTDKIAADRPDIVMWNGHANQYMSAPLQVRAGQRVRLWVLSAGPSRGTSFHVVGGQFDTVFKEGAYRLRPGNAEQGGAQSLDLAAAQGGFVELTFPEPGDYVFLNHSLVDAERGAKGLIRVSP